MCPFVRAIEVAPRNLHTVLGKNHEKEKCSHTIYSFYVKELCPPLQACVKESRLSFQKCTWLRQGNHTCVEIMFLSGLGKGIPK